MYLQLLNILLTAEVLLVLSDLSFFYLSMTSQGLDLTDVYCAFLCVSSLLCSLLMLIWCLNTEKRWQSSGKGGTTVSLVQKALLLPAKCSVLLSY